MKQTINLCCLLLFLCTTIQLNANGDDPTTSPSMPKPTIIQLPPIVRISSLHHLGDLVPGKPSPKTTASTPSSGAGSCVTPTTSISHSSSTDSPLSASSPSSKRRIHLASLTKASPANIRAKICEYRLLISEIKEHRSRLESLIFWQAQFNDFLEKTGLRKAFDGLREMMKRRKKSSRNIDFFATATTIVQRYQHTFSDENSFESSQIIKGLAYSCTTNPGTYLDFEPLKTEVIKGYERQITALTRIVDTAQIPMLKLVGRKPK
jgi:hypothetical protein